MGVKWICMTVKRCYDTQQSLLPIRDFLQLDIISHIYFFTAQFSIEFTFLHNFVQVLVNNLIRCVMFVGMSVIKFYAILDAELYISEVWMYEFHLTINANSKITFCINLDSAVIIYLIVQWLYNKMQLVTFIHYIIVMHLKFGSKMAINTWCRITCKILCILKELYVGNLIPCAVKGLLILFFGL